MDKIKEYYGNHYKVDRACNAISDLKWIGSVNKYLLDIDRPNIYAKVMDHQLININCNSINPRLRRVMAHYEDLHPKPSKGK